MTEALYNMLRCPVCKGALDRSPADLRCAACRKTYPIVLGIPDLRLYEDPLIPLEDDYRKGEKLQAQAETLSFAELVHYYWSLPTYPPTPADLSARFIQHVVDDDERAQAYKRKLGSGKALLETGCGTAALTKVAAPQFGLAVASDVAFRWLIVARKRLQEAGLPPNLVCCCADHLPFPDGCFSTVASVALLEHVPDAGAAIREFSRVTESSGRVFVWTSNRFSFAPEPHVRVWGVGFLPRRWMPAYVKWRRGMAYEKKHLLSCFEIRRMLRGAGLRVVQFSLPAVTRPDWDALRGLERWAARCFASASRIPVIRSLLVIVSPVMQLVARRSRGSSAL